ncbi:MAG: hypothetical protein Q4F05_08270 [bacterium]|nr:hypothetical protein [bacterium]
MHIWTLQKWKSKYKDKEVRTSVRLRFDKDVNEEVKISCKNFCRWIRKEFYFPIRVPIYVKSSYQLKTMDNDTAVGTFFEPEDPLVEPYIRIATGDYCELVEKKGKDAAKLAILESIAHELTHYFQWVNSLKLTEMDAERQANQYSIFILEEYLEQCHQLHLL